MIEVDVRQLLFPGEYLYAHSIYGEAKITIFPIGEERFWVVEAFAHLVVGSIYEVRPYGLYTSDGRALEVPTSGMNFFGVPYCSPRGYSFSPQCAVACN